MALLQLLASEGGPRSLWDPTILGILVFISALVLFCGSVYLLLATNMGARLGFLVAFAGLSGFMLLLATLWWTTGSSGIDPPHGRSPTWKAVELVDAPDQAKTEAVRTISSDGKKLEGSDLVNLRPAIDAALVPAAEGGESTGPQPLATLGFSSSTDFIIEKPTLEAYEIGGGSKNVFWHNPRYAVVQLCTAAKDATGTAKLPAECDPLEGTKYVVLEYDLGSLRQPVVAYFFMSLALFAISLLGLHWWETDERERKKAALAPVPAGD